MARRRHQDNSIQSVPDDTDHLDQGDGQPPVKRVRREKCYRLMGVSRIDGSTHVVAVTPTIGRMRKSASMFAQILAHHYSERWVERAYRLSMEDLFAGGRGTEEGKVVSA